MIVVVVFDDLGVHYWKPHLFRARWKIANEKHAWDLNEIQTAAAREKAPVPDEIKAGGLINAIDLGNIIYT